MNNLILGDMLQRSNEFYWGNFILMCPSDEITVQTKVLEVEEEDVEQGITIDGKTYSYLMSVQTLQEIADNARDQNENPTVEELVTAFRYYVDHDAFIDFEASLHH